MKILFIVRATIYTNSGGDTVQVLNTAAQLKKLGVDNEIKLCNAKIDYSPFDLIHFFNVIRPADILFHSNRSRLPYVISTIYVDYSEYEKNVRKGISGLLFRSLPSGWIEYFKLIGRSIKNREKIVSKSYLYLGHYRSVRRVLHNAKVLLPNSLNEYKRLLANYHIAKPYKIIPNAIDPEIFKYDAENNLKQNNVVLCVARIEGLKNQLNLISALNNTKYTVYIVGSPATNQAHYYDKCVKAAASNIKFIGKKPQYEILEYYKMARVHILPSWFETTGLSSLEAAAMGCNIVVTDKGDTREYFEDMATYCNPESVDSIRNAVETAAAQPFNEKLMKKVQHEYTWRIAAGKTLEAYNIALTETKI